MWAKCLLDCKCAYVYSGGGSDGEPLCMSCCESLYGCGVMFVQGMPSALGTLAVLLVVVVPRLLSHAVPLAQLLLHQFRLVSCQVAVLPLGQVLVQGHLHPLLVGVGFRHRHHHQGCLKSSRLAACVTSLCLVLVSCGPRMVKDWHATHAFSSGLIFLCSLTPHKLQLVATSGLCV